jgi:hypothetical protein
MVSGHIDRVRRDGNRSGKVHSLPTGSGLIGEGGAGKQGAGVRPQIPAMSAGGGGYCKPPRWDATYCACRASATASRSARQPGAIWVSGSAST